MFNRAIKAQLAECLADQARQEARNSAIDESMALVELTADGCILAANANFLSLTGYGESELVGRHHDMLCEQAGRAGQPEGLWQKLTAGESVRGQFLRLGKDGRELWLQSNYVPLLDADGRITEVLLLATDTTGQRASEQIQQAVIDSLGRSMALIEFGPDGKVLYANRNLRLTMGYGDDDLRGMHHRVFCPEEYAGSRDYDEFWQRLNNLEHFSGRIERVSKHGEPVWLQASYNPVLDRHGKLLKVVKIASDITQDVLTQQQESRAAAMAFDSSVSAEEKARNGAAIVRETVTVVQGIAEEIHSAAEEINAISQQSEQIASIVSAIRGIADQTNLLALNAAIEAARAGEQGRGFAVVADEVRNLAARTAQATEEIVAVVSTNNEMAQTAVINMENSRERVQQGVELANSAGEAIADLSAGAREVVEVMQQMRDTIREH